MNAGQKSARRIASSHVLSRDHICSSCLNRLAHHTSAPRRYASAAAAAAVAEEPTRVHADPTIPPVTQTGPRKAFRVMCSPVLSRPPLITRELTSFEKAYFLYQKRLNERLALPFTRYFYYKKGTPSDLEWKRKAKVRQVAARDVGVYNAYSKEGWDDEVRVGSNLDEPEAIVDNLIRDAEGKDIADAQPQGDAEAAAAAEVVSGNTDAGEAVRKSLGAVTIERPMPRHAKADEENDLKSLSRKMDRSLYLLVKDQADVWRFPQDRVYGRENLNQAAERILLQAGGVDMNTWVVGNHPVGHYIANFREPQVNNITPNKLVSSSTQAFEQEEFGEKIFFMKARIMAGQANVVANEIGIKDFLWLTKEEIQEKVGTSYFGSIRNMMPHR